MVRLRIPLAIVAIGALSLAGQIVLLREASVAFFGVELAYLLGLGAWLLCSALGAVLAPRRSGPRSLALLLVALPATVALAVGWLRAARFLTGGTPGAFLPLSTGLLALLVGLGPSSALAGAVFPVATRAYAGEAGGTFARAYALECIGGIVGGLGVTVALFHGVSAPQIVLASVVLGAAVVLPLAPSRLERWVVVALIGVPAGLALTQATAIDRALTRLDHPNLVATEDSPYARLVVEERGGQAILFSNGAMLTESESVLGEAFVHPVLLEHPRPQRVAVLEGTARGLATEVALHHPRQIVTVDLDPWAAAAARRYFPDRHPPAIGPRVTSSTMDPRRYLREHEGRFDVILIGAPDPESGQSNRYYTKEFFALCARRLGTTGVLGLELRAGENLWSPLVATRLASVDHALRTAFRRVMFLPGVTWVAVASQADLATDPEVLAARLDARSIRARLVGPQYLNYILTNERREEARAQLARSSAAANSDARPICYTTAAMLWVSRFAPSWGFRSPERLQALGRWAPWATGGLLLATGLLAGSIGTRPVRAITLAAVAGFVGMAAESVLILHHQTQSGALFQDIGALLVSYMAGSASSAWLTDAWQRRRGPSVGRGWIVCGALALLGLEMTAVVRKVDLPSRASLLILMFLAGAVVGALLAVAAQQAYGSRGTEAAPLYAADLLGGGFGALVTSLLLIPLAGLDRTSLLLVGAAVACVVLLRPGSLDPDSRVARPGTSAPGSWGPVPR